MEMLKSCLDVRLTGKLSPLIPSGRGGNAKASARGWVLMVGVKEVQGRGARCAGVVGVFWQLRLGWGAPAPGALGGFHLPASPGVSGELLWPAALEHLLGVLCWAELSTFKAATQTWAWEGEPPCCQLSRERQTVPVSLQRGHGLARLSTSHWGEPLCQTKHSRRCWSHTDPAGGLERLPCQPRCRSLLPW